jgi:xanthine dehydrogenase small subunit
MHVEAGHIQTARVALGGMAATAARAPAAEQALIGAPWSQETFERAAAALARDFAPLSDMRASSGYRLTGAANLLRRFFHSYESNFLTRVADVEMAAAAGAVS